MTEVGKKLQQVRSEQGIELEDIADRTRINLDYLKSIEQGKFDFLPEPYVIAFVKTFAKQVGLDGEELAQRLRENYFGAGVGALEQPEEVRGETPSGNRHMAGLPRDRTKTPVAPYLNAVAIGIGIFLAMALVFYFASRSPRQAPASAEPESRGQSDIRVREISFAEMARQAAAESGPLSPVAPERMVLEGKFLERVWIRVVIDDSETVESIYPAGSADTWLASRSFRIRIGNAGAASFTLDGKALGTAGEFGQIADVLMDRTGMVRRQVRQARPAAPSAADSAGTDGIH